MVAYWLIRRRPKYDTGTGLDRFSAAKKTSKFLCANMMHCLEAVDLSSGGSVEWQAPMRREVQGA